MTHGLSIAAISPQWIGIAVASAIVVVLIVILLVRRAAAGKDRSVAPTTAAPLAETPPAADPSATAAPTASPPAAPVEAPPSFLDQPLQNDFDGLGKQVGAQPTLGTVVLPRELRPAGAPGPAVDPLAPRQEPPPPPPMDMGMDMGAPTPSAPVPVPTTGTTPVDAASDAGTAAPQVAASEAGPEGPESDAGPPVVASEAGPEIDGGDAAAAPLSDVIVTTNKAEVDLTDPDVRAMLQELVHDEIALAEVYRQQGQMLDAILQLTEAEKACTALGDAEQSQRIKAMLNELQS